VLLIDPTQPFASRIPERCRGRHKSRKRERAARATPSPVDPETNNAAAMFVNASTARFQDEILLDNGSFVRSGILLDHRGKPQTAWRPTKPTKVRPGTVGEISNLGVEVACGDEWILVQKLFSEGQTGISYGYTQIGRSAARSSFD
jgi:hypothetical protein